MSHRTDEQLVVAVGKGDKGALGILYERHHRRVHSLCYRMSGDPATADDLLQETFLKVLRHGRGFKSKATFTTWLYRVTRNVCLDHLNAETRKQERAAELSQAVEIDMQVPTANPNLEKIREALYRLPPDKREILVLSRYEGLSYKEIAEVCSTTVGAIKVRAHRAIRELRRNYEELENLT